MRFARLALILLLGAACTHAAAAQKRTIEKRTPVDSTTTIVETQTEDITPRHHLMIVDPLRFFVLYNAAYYQAVTPALALGAGLQVPAFDAIDGVIVTAEARFYVRKQALKGFYVAPNLWIDSVTEHDDTRVELGVVAGWQWFTGRDFALGFGLGAAFDLNGPGNDTYGLYDGSRPIVRFNIGYAF